MPIISVSGLTNVSLSVPMNQVIHVRLGRLQSDLTLADGARYYWLVNLVKR